MTEERTIGLGAGLASFILVVVIAWALAAVLMLTGTLTAAHQINDRVKLVNRTYDPIDKNLTFVGLAGRTGQITAKINAAAQPLSGELTQVIATAGRINTNVGSILTTAHAINGTVTAINGNVHAINSTVHSIGSNVQSIGGSVASAGNSVASIHARVAAVEGAVGPVGAGGHSINADVVGIRNRLGATLRTSRALRFGIVGINVRTQAVIDIVTPLKDLFDKILGDVGTTIDTATVLGHANSIDCSRLINLAGPTQACGR